MKGNIIITGAAGNLGQAVVKKFLSNGYNVIATVSSGKDLGYTVSGNVDVYEADLTDETKVINLVQQLTGKYKPIEAELLLAGGYISGNIQTKKIPSKKKMVGLNFETAYNMARSVFNQMITQANGGRIIMVGARPVLKP